MDQIMRELVRHVAGGALAPVQLQGLIRAGKKQPSTVALLSLSAVAGAGSEQGTRHWNVRRARATRSASVKGGAERRK
jgi:hypothetical protein